MNKRFPRQTLLYALISFTYADLPAGEFVPLVELPPGAVQVPGLSFIDVETVSNTGTTDVLDIGTEASPNAYGNDVNFKAAARTALTGVPVGRGAAKRTIGITRTPVGTAATAGEGILCVAYIQAGRQQEQYGSLDSGPVTT